MYEEILFDVQGHVATITLNRPERLNAFSDTMLGEWADAIRSCARDEDVRVVVLTGSGRGFCAGADLKARAQRNATEDVTPASRRNSLRYTVHQVAQATQLLDKPYIVAVNGAAVGAGMDMCSMADIRFASDRARFGMSYVNVGLVPGNGGAWMLPRLFGVQKALDLLWTGELFDANRALELGYVFKVFPHEELMASTYSYANRLAAGPPIAIQAMKQLVYRGLTTNFSEALMAAQSAMALVQSTDDAKEGPQAFVEKRPPNFTGK